ncbi:MULTISPECIES: hypothetical protein [Tenacibaculum]|uniref:hypothetical protein n=1 Tax=Tenacibaculum TaxID=104267 RepID=UPI0008995B77|nr:MULTISPECIES: hypothetical protein [unclassified Tenacibaculum]RBW56997.1 hypothetical protein DS884_12550 [Tenacibaculum sp. E3R01]SED43114.1 hypothetical protein SAMN04487765_0144 [Tenacibaculum sp. MAR_2010_89]
MGTFYSFDDEAIEQALEAARNTHGGGELKAANASFDTTKGGDLFVSAQCVSVTVENHKICIKLPLGFGKHCFSIPVSIPNGTAGKACIGICTTWGIPTGVKLSVVIGGVTVISQTFGKC